MGKLVKGINDLQTVSPETAKRWNYEKNGDLKPSDVAFASMKVVWWKCEKGHEWETTVANASRKGRGCPYCANKRVLKGYNDLATTNPDLLKEWDYEANVFKPEEVTRGSVKKIHWICSKGHKWIASPNDRTKKNPHGCPICFKEKQTSFPEQAIFFYIKQAFPDAENGNKTAVGLELDIYIPSIRTAIEYDGLAWHHKTKNLISDEAKNRACLENNIKLIRIRENGLIFFCECSCLERKDNESVESLDETITQLLSFLGKENFDVNIQRDNILILNSYVYEEKKNSLSVKFPNIASEWNYEKNGDLKPTNVNYGSHKKVWWKCKNGHEWEATIHDRCTNGNGCPACSGKGIIAGVNDLATTHPNVVREWDYEKNEKKPDEISFGSGKKVWWICPENHSYQASIKQKINEYNCPFCSKNKILTKEKKFLSNFPETLSKWDYEKNGDIEPENISSGIRRKFWWICPEGHRYQNFVPDEIRRKGKCPICRKEEILRKNPPVVCIEENRVFCNAKIAIEEITGKYDRRYGRIYQICGLSNRTCYSYHWRLATEEEKASIGLVETSNEEIAPKKIQFDSNRSDAYNKMTIDKVSQVMMPGEEMKISVVA